MKNKQEIIKRASEIAQSLWDDREKNGTLEAQLLAVAGNGNHGTDGDLTSDDRSALRALAAAAKQKNL